MLLKHPRIYKPDLPRDGDIIITGDKYYHLARSVRARPGDEFKLFNGNGLFANALITKIDSESIKAQITQYEEIDNTPDVKLTLAFGMLSADSLKNLIAGATQLGVIAFMPIISIFNDINIPTEKLDRILQRWNKLIIENAAIASRSHLPRIEAPIDLKTVVENSKASDHKFTFWEVDGIHWSKHLPLYSGSVIAVTGPKGGLHEDELHLLETSGFITLSLGKLVMKSEFAAIAACARIIGK